MRQQPNRAGEMAAFVRVVEAGGFAPAARTLGLSPSALSKLVSRLEARLGVMLLRRSTRRLAPTPEGAAFHERAVAILDDIEAAEYDVFSRRAATSTWRKLSEAARCAALVRLPGLTEASPSVAGVAGGAPPVGQP